MKIYQSDTTMQTAPQRCKKEDYSSITKRFTKSTTAIGHITDSQVKKNKIAHNAKKSVETVRFSFIFTTFAMSVLLA